MWIVEIVQPVTKIAFKDDYFPRRFHYKSDAVQLKKDVSKAGGIARIIHHSEYKKDWLNIPQDW